MQRSNTTSWLQGGRVKFKDKDFKEAVKWLKENNYPLDLTKHMIDFTVVDLANLLFEAQEKYR